VTRTETRRVSVAVVLWKGTAHRTSATFQSRKPYIDPSSSAGDDSTNLGNEAGYFELDLPLPAAGFPRNAGVDVIFDGDRGETYHAKVRSAIRLDVACGSTAH